MRLAAVLERQLPHAFERLLIDREPLLVDGVNLLAEDFAALQNRVRVHEPILDFGEQRRGTVRTSATNGERSNDGC